MEISQTINRKEARMQLKTILNRIQKFKSFVYGKVRWVEQAEEPTLEAEIIARKNSHPLCSICGCPAPGYDTLPVRRFEFIPMWGIKVFFVYALRRVNCPDFRRIFLCCVHDSIFSSGGVSLKPGAVHLSAA